MSLQKMNKPELQKIAQALFVEVEDKATKAEIVAALVEADVTQEDYENLDVLDPEPSGVVTTSDFGKKVEPEEPKLSGDKIDTSKHSILLKFERANPSYEIMTYKFSRENPFQLVTVEDAEYIVKSIPGFRTALPSEADDYYN